MARLTEGKEEREYWLDNMIRQFISTADCDDLDDTIFNRIALELFTYQFDYCPPYQAYCRSLQVQPSEVKHWSQIPPVPTEAFKEAIIATCDPADANFVFATSGTSAGARSGFVYRDSSALELCRVAWLRCYWEYMAPDRIRLPLFSLAPTPQQAPQASIAHCLAAITEECGGPESDNFLTEEGLAFERLMVVLKDAEAEGKPVEIYGATFSFVHFFDWCDQHGCRFQLSQASRIAHGSGYKGRARELTPAEFLERSVEVLSIPPEYNVNVLGMTELGSQFYDNMLRNAVSARKAPRYKAMQPWARTRVVDPETWDTVPEGEVGVLVHYDLSLRGNVLAVQTEDVGVAIEDGFEILGRATGAEARGCNLTVERWIDSNLLEE